MTRDSILAHWRRLGPAPGVMATPSVRLFAFLLGTALAAALASIVLADAAMTWRAAYLPILLTNLVIGVPAFLVCLGIKRVLPIGNPSGGAVAWLLAGFVPFFLPTFFGMGMWWIWALALAILPALCLRLFANIGGPGKAGGYLALLVCAIGGGFYTGFGTYYELQDMLKEKAAPKLGPEADTPAATAPDIILISLDTLRADAIVGPRPEGYEIPWFDSVRERGTWWDYAYSSSNQTLPGHASMLSGRDQPRSGIRYNQDVMPSRERLPLVQDMFLGNGFRTAGVISNTLIAGGMGFGHGFEGYDDSTTEFYGPMNDCMARLRFASLFGLTPLKLQQAFLLQTGFHALRRAPRPMSGRPQRERGAVTNEQAEEIFDQLYESDRPYFFFLHYLDAHHPYGAPAEFDGRVSSKLQKPDSKWLGDPKQEGMIRMPELVMLRDALLSEDPVVAAEAQDVAKYYHALYLENVMYLDHLLAAIEARVQASGRPAIWLITSDHGEQFGENNSILHGNHLYQDSVRVPFLMMGPGIPADQRREEIPDLADVAPTLLGLVNIEPPEDMTGRPLFTRDSWPERGHHFADDDRIGARLGAMKMISNRGGDDGYLPTALYDLHQDPREAANLWSNGAALPDPLLQVVLEGIREDAWQQVTGALSFGQERALNDLGYVGHDDPAPVVED